MLKFIPIFVVIVYFMRGVGYYGQEYLMNYVGDSIRTRRTDEKIVLLVPKRNIETWIHYLKGEAVDQETASPKFTTRERL